MEPIFCRHSSWIIYWPRNLLELIQQIQLTGSAEREVEALKTLHAKLPQVRKRFAVR